MNIWGDFLFLLVGIFFQLICLFFVVVALLVSLYYWFWALLAVARRGDHDEGECYDLHFAICIPAHDEGDVIQHSLQKLSKIDYPKEKFDIFVIADNCTDNTAEIVRQNGFNCIERIDGKNKGKGFAVRFGIDHILSSAHRYHAIVIVDADCYLDPKSLKLFGKNLCSGKKVLQANFKITNCNENPMTFIACLGNFIENRLFYSPKSQIGASCFLQGTGMVISREVLLTHSWNAFSNSEDFEYSLSLMKDGICVTFVDGAYVCTKTPSTKEQLKIQRTRWASGTIGLGKLYGFQLIVEGVCSRNLILIDAGISILTASRPLIMLFTLCTVLYSGVLLILLPRFIFSTCMVGVSLLSFGLQVGYYSFGLLQMGITKRRLKLCFGVLRVGLELMLIACSGCGKKTETEWKRTPR